jgi:hypothetical protein
VKANTREGEVGAGGLDLGHVERARMRSCWETNRMRMVNERKSHMFHVKGLGVGGSEVF